MASRRRVRAPDDPARAPADRPLRADLQPPSSGQRDLAPQRRRQVGEAVAGAAPADRGRSASRRVERRRLRHFSAAVVATLRGTFLVAHRHPARHRGACARRGSRGRGFPPDRQRRGRNRARARRHGDHAEQHGAGVHHGCGRRHAAARRLRERGGRSRRVPHHRPPPGRTPVAGSPAALLRPGPLRTVGAGRPRTRLKQASRARGWAEVPGCCGGRRGADVRSARGGGGMRRCRPRSPVPSRRSRRVVGSPCG